MYYQLTEEAKTKLPDLVHNSKSAASYLNEEIHMIMSQSGLYFNNFSRVKAAPSLAAKLLRNPEKYILKEFEPEIEKEEPRITDFIGCRIVLYFQQDIDICREILTRVFELDEINTTVDQLEANEFGAIRTNLIFSMTDEMKRRVDPEIFQNYPIAPKFEVQIRTTFSEGWHEVEHDMVYKHPEEWAQASYRHPKRRLNGLYATLEGCDSMMEMILDERATFCYANIQQDEMFSNMLRYKFRIRFTDTQIDPALEELFRNPKNSTLLRELYEYKRTSVLACMTSPELADFDKNMDNVIYITGALMAFEKLVGLKLKEMRNPLNRKLVQVGGKHFIQICDAVTRYLGISADENSLNFHFRQTLYKNKLLSFSDEHAPEFADFFCDIQTVKHPKDFKIIHTPTGRKDGFNPKNGTYYYIYTSDDVLRKKSAAAVWATMAELYEKILAEYEQADKIRKFVFVVNSKASTSLPGPIVDGVTALNESSKIPVSVLGTNKLMKRFFDLPRAKQRELLGLKKLPEVSDMKK